MKKRTRFMAILLACVLSASTILPSMNVYAVEPNIQKTDAMTETIPGEEEKDVPEQTTEVPDKVEKTESTGKSNLLDEKNGLTKSETQVQNTQDGRSE